MNKYILNQVIIDQEEIFKRKEKLVEREIGKNFISSPKISVITGVRRCGKSTLMKLLSENYENYFYFNFEDERLLDFNHENFNDLLELAYELYGSKIDAFFFDEIQNVTGWEKFVRRLFSEKKKVYITGSNSKLLSSEFSTSLTGRYVKTELYPFSFKEFLKISDVELKTNLTTANRAELKKYFNEYISIGGFPEVIKSKDKNELSQLYQDVLVKDLIVRFGIRDTKSFRELALYLLSNISSLYSYNNLAKLLSIKSTNSVKNYIEFLEEAYLFLSVPKYEFFLKKQIVRNKKIYTIDTGIFNAVSFSFSENRGKLLENIVLLELKRNAKDVYYFKNIKECDFIVSKDNRLHSTIQVTEVLNKSNQDREINGLIEAITDLKVKNGFILTYDQFDEFTIGKHKIKVLPIWYWIIFGTN
ncbi:MAG TPA: ATP-binding protein [Ignavibacteria bacterium]